MTGALSGDDGDLSAMVGRIADEFLNDHASEARRLLGQLAADQPSAAAAVNATVPLLRLLAQAPLDASCEQAAAVRLGDFQLLRPIAQGGMGVVYEAVQLSLGRRVAVKVLTLAGTLDDRRLRRFQVEARAASLLSHPHVVPVYAVGFDEGVHYYAMQFIDGHSLADPAVWRRLAPEAPLSPCERIERVVQLGIQAAEALHYSHTEGIVHRDVKPSNLLVDASGRLWVADFGLAHVQAEAGFTATGDLLGTLCYMSPEQLQTAALVDHRTDVYSLGVTLYELLAERPAFAGAGREFVLRSILGAQLEPLRRVRPEIPRDLETVVRRATAFDRDQRYATAAALAEDLRRVRDGRPIVAQRPSRWRSFRYWVQRNRLLAATSAALLATLMVLAVGGPWAAWRQRRLTAEAHTQLHISEMNLAYQAWSAGHVDRAAELLALRETRPLYGDSRDFPHRYLSKSLRAAEQSVLYRHEGRLNDVVVSPDGRLVAYCGGETGVRVLDARTQAVVASLGEPSRLIGSLAFADGGATLVANHKDPGLILWNCADWSPREVELPLEYSVRVLQASPSGTLFAVGSFGGEVAVCGSSGKCLWNAQATAGQIWGVAFSPDESQIVTVSDDHSVMLWSVQSGEKLKDLPRLRSSAYDVVWSNDGTRVFVACGEGVRCVDVASGALLEGLADDLGSTACVAVHGNLLATGGYDHTVALWDVDSGARLAKLTAHRQAVSSLTISLDGKLLWSAGNDGELRTWDLARLESAAATKSQADKQWTCGLEISPDGRFAVSIGTRYAAGDAFDHVQGKLVVWDASRGVALRSIEVEPRFGFDVSVSDDLKVCASAGLGGVRLWNFDDLTVARDLHRADEHEFCTVAISPDGRWLAAGGRDRPKSYDESAIVLLWDLRASSPAPQRLALSNHAGEVFTLGFSNDGRRLAIASGNWDQGSVDVWSLEGDAWQESDVALTSHEHMAFDAAFLSDSLHLASTGSGGEVAIAACGQRQTQFALLTSTGFSIAASPDDMLIALGGNGQICLWDRLAKQQLAVIQINSWANALAFTPDGEALVWTGGDGSVHWELSVRPLPANSGAP